MGAFNMGFDGVKLHRLTEGEHTNGQRLVEHGDTTSRTSTLYLSATSVGLVTVNSFDTMSPGAMSPTSNTSAGDTLKLGVKPSPVSATRQGLTLVRLSTEPEPFLTQNTPETPPVNP